ncbi:Ankyrin repeat-containing protein [Cynara cardunculus var. scolymus]|uniref:Ankyrin repeat-containing protein n=1 Tax=Cynara cardunculus var. scolymus TaxID=59895 RepID=A0A103QLD7_CYNCS|nr:Ankyrin repeat-containing protein [Cynara cardunculus var. scolymus]
MIGSRDQDMGDHDLSKREGGAATEAMVLSGKHNYHRWETQMLCLMETHYMRGLVDDAFVHGPRASSEKIRKQYDNLLKGWIFGSVSEGVLDTVVDRSSAKEVWDTLKSLYKLRSAEDVEPTMSSQQGPEEIETESEDSISEDIEADPFSLEAERRHAKARDKLGLMLYKDTSEWSWREIIKILEGDKDVLKDELWDNGNTLLHMVVEKGQNAYDIVEKLLLFIRKKKEEKEILEHKNADGSTALHVAVSVGNKHAMKLLVDQHKDLLTIRDKKDQDPLIKAFNNMQFDTFVYLFKVAVGNDKAKQLVISQGSKKGASLVVNAITAKQYSTAHELIRTFPKFSTESDRVLMAIARTFPNELNYWETLVYPTLTYLDVCGGGGGGGGRGAVPPIKHIEKKIKVSKEAKRVLQLVCYKIHMLTLLGTPHPYYDKPILEAAIKNADNVFTCILIYSPEAIKSRHENGYDIFQLAVIHRSDKIYNRLYLIGEDKNRYRTIKDSSENNMLHLAGRSAPSQVLKRRTGAALQLQRELQWFEELKNFMHPSAITEENSFGETPHQVFTREHENLVKEGEKWMKTTAESCSISAALITTIVFTAAITVPGGSDQQTGIPILPKRLIIGLCTLLLSITSMMVAFGATLYLLFCRENPWMLGPICGLSCLPILFFVTLQFPLIADLYRSTYVPIFHKRMRMRMRRKELGKAKAKEKHRRQAKEKC